MGSDALSFDRRTISGMQWSEWKMTTAPLEWRASSRRKHDQRHALMWCLHLVHGHDGRVHARRMGLSKNRRGSESSSLEMGAGGSGTYTDFVVEPNLKQGSGMWARAQFTIWHTTARTPKHRTKLSFCGGSRLHRFFRCQRPRLF